MRLAVLKERVRSLRRARPSRHSRADRVRSPGSARPVVPGTARFREAKQQNDSRAVTRGSGFLVIFVRILECLTAPGTPDRAQDPIAGSTAICWRPCH